MGSPLPPFPSDPCAVLPSHRHLLQVPQGQWAVLRALPAYAALPPPLQAAFRAAANRDPPRVWRSTGNRTFSVSAAAYRAAGGQLRPDEAAAMAEYEAAHAPAPAPAAAQAAAGQRRAPKRGRAGVAAAMPQQAQQQEEPQPYEISQAEKEASSLFKDGCLDMTLARDAPYESSYEFRCGVGHCCVACTHRTNQLWASQGVALGGDLY